MHFTGHLKLKTSYLICSSGFKIKQNPRLLAVKLTFLDTSVTTFREVSLNIKVLNRRTATMVLLNRVTGFRSRLVGLGLIDVSVYLFIL